VQNTRAVADVVAVPVDEQVGGGAVDQLEPALSYPLPLVGRRPLAHDPAGDRDELVVDIRDALGVYLGPDAPHRFGAAVGSEKPLEVGGHSAS
jgi:hypothetical protein